MTATHYIFIGLFIFVASASSFSLGKRIGYAEGVAENAKTLAVSAAEKAWDKITD